MDHAETLPYQPNKGDKKISFHFDPEEKLKNPTSSFYKYNKTAHKINTQDAPPIRTEERTQNSDTFDFDTLRNEFIGAPKLPGISGLLTSRGKGSDLSISNQNLINLTKYAQNLEHIIRFKNKEIQRLEYLNKYLVIAQQKRDEMLTHTLEENRRLKEIATRAEKMQHVVEKRSQKNSNPSALYFSASSPTFKKPSGLAHLKQGMSPRSTDRGGIRIFKKNTGTANTPRGANNPLDPQRAFSKLYDEKKGQSILKMNEQDAYTIYNENEHLKFLENLVREEENFIQNIRTWEDTLLISVYDAIHNILRENRTLFDLVLKLKKIVKAANNMTQHLILLETMEEIVDQVCECLDCDRATLWLVDEEKEELWSKVAKGSNETIRIPWNKGIVGTVIQKREPLNIVNAYADERFNKEVDMRTNYKTHTILCIPIIDDRKGYLQNAPVIGVIQAINKNSGIFTKDDEGLLTILSSLANTIIKNSMYFDKEKLFHNSLRAILNTGIYLNSYFGMAKLLPRAEAKLQAIMNVEHGKIFVRDRVENVLFRYTSKGEKECYPINCGIAGHVMKQGEYENTTNAYSSPLYNGQIDIETSMPIITWPIKHPSNEREVIGVFEVVNVRGIQGMSHTARPKLNTFDFETLSFFSKQLAQVIVNNQIYEKLDTYTEDVTNLLEFQEKIEKSMQDLSRVTDLEKLEQVMKSHDPKNNLLAAMESRVFDNPSSRRGSLRVEKA